MKKERSLSSDSIATVLSDELSLDGSLSLEAGADGTSIAKAKIIHNGNRKNRVLCSSVGLVVVALVVGLGVGLTKRDSSPKPQEVTATQSSPDDEPKDSSNIGTPTASSTPKPTNAVFLTNNGFECTEHAACRCYDEVCESSKGVFTTHALEYGECEEKCLAEEVCNGIEYNAIDGTCEIHTGQLTDRKSNHDTLCCEKDQGAGSANGDNAALTSAIADIVGKEVKEDVATDGETTLDHIVGSTISSKQNKYGKDDVIQVSFVNLEPSRGDWVALVKVEFDFVCDEHTACRCYEDKCAHTKGVYNTHEDTLKEICESLCMEDAECNGIEYNELDQKCETHVDFLTDRKDNEDTLCCEKKMSFNSLPVDFKYACGSQSCNETADNGTLSFNAAALAVGATYEAHLLSKTGFDIKAKTKPFAVVGDGL